MATSATWRGNDWKRELKTPEQKYIMKCGAFVERRAKQLCPVKFGVLMSSIHTKYNTAEIAAYIGTSAESMNNASKTGTVTFYAPYVEFGTYASRQPPFDTHTIGMKPRPFLRPALDELKVKLR